MTDRGRPMTRRLLGRAAEIYAARFPAADGRIGATFEIVYLTGWAPSADQPKALAPDRPRRGSPTRSGRRNAAPGTGWRGTGWRRRGWRGARRRRRR